MLALYRYGRQTDALRATATRYTPFSRSSVSCLGLAAGAGAADPDTIRPAGMAAGAENVPTLPDRLIGRSRELDELQASSRIHPTVGDADGLQVGQDAACA